MHFAAEYDALNSVMALLFRHANVNAVDEVAFPLFLWSPHSISKRNYHIVITLLRLFVSSVIISCI